MASIMRISFKASDKDVRLLKKALDRYATLVENSCEEMIDHNDYRMDLLACHANGCPMDFKMLSKADDFNLVHDICGIRDHLDRSIGKLGGHFLPRCHARKRVGS